MTCNDTCIHFPVCEQKKYDFANIDECEYYKEERPKGKWIGDTDYESCQGNYEAYKCSECGYGIDWRKHHQLMCQDKIPEEYREYYCPHCGADMRGYV